MFKEVYREETREYEVSGKYLDGMHGAIGSEEDYFRCLDPDLKGFRPTKAAYFDRGGEAVAVVTFEKVVMDYV